jgi:hypothetical protein
MPSNCTQALIQQLIRFNDRLHNQIRRFIG